MQKKTPRGFAPRNDHEIDHLKLVIVLVMISIMMFAFLSVVVGVSLYRFVVSSVPAIGSFVVRVTRLAIF